MTKKILITFLAVTGLVLSACGGGTSEASRSDNTPADTASATVSQSTQNTSSSGSTVKIAGSTSVAPLMKELKEAYAATGSDTVIEIQETGSSAGITATIEGASDIGMSSRDLKDEEKASGLDDTAIALDGIAIIVNPENPVQDLTTEQISAIYKGEISNWNELGGNDGTIIVVSREEGSGTRGAFEELLKLEESVDGGTRSLVSDDALFENSTGAVKTNVSGSKNAIGYISLGTLDDSVAAVSVGGVECSVSNVKNGSYVVSRPFLICTSGEVAENVQAFIDYILSDAGQEIVMDHSYISIN